MIRRLAALLATALLGGCASLVAPSPAAGDEMAACARWFARLDAAVERHGVRDVEADRIAGFAGLRVDRVAAALRERAAAEPAAFAAWLARLQRLDAEGREVEIGNLPPAAYPIDDAHDAGTARAATQRCIGAWTAPLTRDPSLRAALLARAEVPDRYLGLQRALGLYPLVRWPFHAGVRGWERDLSATVSQWSTAPPAVRRYTAPAAAATGFTAPAWHAPARDALGLPLFSEAERAALLAAHAPAIEIEDTGRSFDRFGALGRRDGETPFVDPQRPMLYQRMSVTRYGDRWLPQLVYSLWFPERPPRGGVDLLAGKLDAVLLRITLAPDDGRLLIVDTIHGCGCYHQFMPTAELRLRAGAPADIEWAFVPITLPTLRPGERLVVRLNSAEHYLVGIARDVGSPGVPYHLQDDDRLRRLPTPSGGTRSLYGPDGLVAGSERAERYFYWPMGIASAGAMRQWSHHATAFVGRRHFDDADLIERRFVIKALE